MSVFELADGPRSINGGVQRLDTRQLFPQTSAISNTRPGVSGASTGQTTFQWQEDVMSWIPSLSYFNIRGHFTTAAGIALDRFTVAQLAYCDNWVSALFSQVQVFLNSQSVELLQNPPQADTALLMSSVDRTWLKSFGSASGVGEAFSTRSLNSAQFGIAAAGAGNYNEVCATWRPAISLFDTATGIPCGGQWRIDLSWANNGEQQMVESLIAQIAGTDYIFTLDELTFYKTTVMPDVSVPKPISGFIELNPVQVNIYPLTGGSTLQVNVPLPSTCNRMLVCIQDNNSANGFAAGQNGLKPITSFAAAVSDGAGDLLSYLQSFYVSFPDLGYQYPNPTYNLTGQVPAVGRAKSEWQRAYGDWINICRGASGGYEGSVPFGSFDRGIRAAILAPNSNGGGAAGIMQVGDPNNDQQAWIASVGAGGQSVDAGDQTALWGWLGRCPGPILAVPVIRPPDRAASTANLFMQFSGNVTSANIYVIMSYSMGIGCEQTPDGKYMFEIMRGL